MRIKINNPCKVHTLSLMHNIYSINNSNQRNNRIRCGRLGFLGSPELEINMEDVYLRSSGSTPGEGKGQEGSRVGQREVDSSSASVTAVPTGKLGKPSRVSSPCVKESGPLASGTNQSWDTGCSIRGSSL